MKEGRGLLTQQLPGKGIIPGILQKMFEKLGNNILKSMTIAWINLLRKTWLKDLQIWKRKLEESAVQIIGEGKHIVEKMEFPENMMKTVTRETNGPGCGIAGRRGEKINQK